MNYWIKELNYMCKKGSTAVNKNTREGRDFCKRKTSKEPTKSWIKPHDTEDTKGVIRSTGARGMDHPPFF